jgi:hypothetical protein
MKVQANTDALYAQLLSAEREAAAHRPDNKPDPQSTGAGNAKGLGAELQRMGDSVHFSAESTMRLAQEALQTEVGKKVAHAFELAGIDMTDAIGIDWSPVATARRIFDFAAGMYGVWRQQNEKMDDSELIDSFEKTVRGAVDQGFSQAMKVLKGMELEEQTRPTAEKTIHTVHSLFDDFFAGLRNPSPQGSQVSSGNE